MRYWYLNHIRHSREDAHLPQVGDIIEYDTLSLTLTHIAYDTENYPIWLGRIQGAGERYQFDDHDVIAWGRKGIARSLPAYKEGKYYIFSTKKSYLWT
jgi:hypothetical protein